MAWLEAELNCATLVGAEAGLQHLKQVDTIRRSLPASWPSQPAAVYDLACYLAEREPLLAPAGADAVP